MCQLDLRIAGSNFFNCRAPEQAVFQNIRLVDRNEPVLSRLSDLKRQMSNPFDLGRLVYHRVHGNLLTRLFASSLRLTKIQTSRQLSDAEDFEAAFDDIATQRRSN